MLTILDVLAVRDVTTRGDFWREQDYIQIAEVEKPISYADLVLKAQESIKGKKIAVPKMYLGHGRRNVMSEYLPIFKSKANANHQTLVGEIFTQNRQ